MKSVTTLEYAMNVQMRICACPKTGTTDDPQNHTNLHAQEPIIVKQFDAVGMGKVYLGEDVRL